MHYGRQWMDKWGILQSDSQLDKQDLCEQSFNKYFVSQHGVIAACRSNNFNFGKNKYVAPEIWMEVNDIGRLIQRRVLLQLDELAFNAIEQPIYVRLPWLKYTLALLCRASLWSHQQGTTNPSIMMVQKFCSINGRCSRDIRHPGYLGHYPWLNFQYIIIIIVIYQWIHACYWRKIFLLDTS